MSTMPVAEIIAIGTELLLGQIQDTNTSYIAHDLNEAGIDIYRATIIGDNEKRIAALIRETLERADIIITTGGLGPTVDDPTRNAVALAFNIKMSSIQNYGRKLRNIIVVMDASLQKIINARLIFLQGQW